MAQGNIKVTVRDNQNILFDGEVDRISSFNEEGPFDIFPMHANFISIINKQISLYIYNKLVKQFKIEQAIMKVKRDTVQIYLGIEAYVIEQEEENKKPSS